MCGFIGVLNDFEISEPILSNMTNTLMNRGPDDRGIWTDKRFGIGFGHTRLSILDLSINGKQPMLSKNEQYIIIFNGEIYNHLDLRKEINELNVTKWRGHSDTETLLESISVFGLEDTLKKINGMFSFALWDRKNKELYLSRDHIGQKPLYYGWNNGIFFFASELKAMKTHPKFRGTINKEAVKNLIEYNYIPDDQSIYKNIFKLTPASYIKLTQTDIKSKNYSNLKKIKYWNSYDKIDNYAYTNVIDIQNRLEKLILKSVKSQMLSDVPLGAFLSGGIDSSLIVSMMQAQSSSRIKTFTIGFNEDEFNEASNARDIANYLKTDHSELYFSANDCLDILQEIPYMYNEPFSDPSALPTALLSKMTKNSVSVALSGDGGDEIFGGYSRYKSLPKIYNSTNDNWLSFFITPLYEIFSRLNDSYIDKFGKVLRIDQLSDKFRKANIISKKENKIEAFQSILKNSEITNQFLNFNNDNYFIEKKINKFELNYDFQEMMMNVDKETYLSGDILVKVDRAAMYYSLETRVPYLSPELIEFSNSMPLSMKLDTRNSKIVLRNILSKYCPQSFFSKKKKGFNVPIDTWLRGSLKSWASDILNSKEFVNSEFFNVSEINQIWKEHQKGRKNWHRILWSILTFQTWLIEHEK